MGDSSSQSWPFVIVLALLLAGITFVAVIVVTVLVLATQLASPA
jgi:hypothetical protein